MYFFRNFLVYAIIFGCLLLVYKALRDFQGKK